MGKWGDRFFYWPDRKQRGTPADADLRYEEVTFSADDGPRLHGWFLPAADGRSPRATVVQFHGNAGNITGHYQLVGWLPRFGFNVLCFDYRGYGRSEGRIDRAGSLADARASLAYVKSRPDVDPQAIVVLGQSIGGAIAAVVCAGRNDLRAVVLDCPFSSYRRMAGYVLKRTIVFWPSARLITRLLVSDGPDPIDYLAHIAPTPLLITECTADEVLDHRMSRELYELAGEPKRLLCYEGASHCGQWFDERLMDRARADLLAFFKTALAQTAAKSDV